MSILKYIFCVLSVSFYAQSNGDLLPKYNRQLDKTIKKNLKLTDYQLEDIDYNSGQLSLIKTANEPIGYALISEVAACNLGGCVAYDQIKTSLSSEYFDLLVIADMDNSIISLEILDYFSDYGYEITAKSYLKKFKGKNICQFSNKTDGIDAISGATISSYALEGSLDLLCRKLSHLEE